VDPRDEVRELRKMDRDGEDLLATGAGIDPASLRVDRGTVRWTGSGRAFLERLGTGGRCTASNTSTLARSAEVRVFWRHEGVFGCHLATGLTTMMGGRPLDTFEYYGAGHVGAAGHFASIDNGSAGRGGGRAGLNVIDLADGSVVHTWHPEIQALVHSVVLAPSGAIAWIGSREGPPGTFQTEVLKSDTDGEAVVLDSDQAQGRIDPRLLRLDGRVASWTRHGETRTAELGQPIIPAPTVAFVASSTRMKLPVARLRR